MTRWFTKCYRICLAWILLRGTMLKVGCFSLSDCRVLRMRSGVKKEITGHRCERVYRYVIVCTRAAFADLTTKFDGRACVWNSKFFPPAGDDSSNYVFQLHIGSKAFSSPLIYSVRAAAISDEMQYTRAGGNIATANSRQLSLRRRDENQFSPSQLTGNDYYLHRETDLYHIILYIVFRESRRRRSESDLHRPGRFERLQVRYIVLYYIIVMCII